MNKYTPKISSDNLHLLWVKLVSGATFRNSSERAHRTHRIGLLWVPRSHFPPRLMLGRDALCWLLIHGICAGWLPCGLKFCKNCFLSIYSLPRWPCSSFDTWDVICLRAFALTAASPSSLLGTNVGSLPHSIYACFQVLFIRPPSSDHLVLWGRNSCPLFFLLTLYFSSQHVSSLPQTSQTKFILFAFLHYGSSIRMWCEDGRGHVHFKPTQSQHGSVRHSRDLEQCVMWWKPSVNTC